MRKRSYAKVVALVSIVAILSLTAPGLFAGDFNQVFNFARFLDRPGFFLFSFFYFTPTYDVGKVLGPPSIEKGNTNPIKVMGLIDSVRPADQD